ncbi:MAG: HAMP domain-containing histidine kinase [Gemmatimonadaceae bacterium]|nr:HAMP domain-containing histidine kinase [Gemmatimonadaceae bacterium]
MRTTERSFDSDAGEVRAMSDVMPRPGEFSQQYADDARSQDERAAVAYAIVHGPAHTIVHANGGFASLANPGTSGDHPGVPRDPLGAAALTGRPVADVLRATAAGVKVLALLERVRVTGSPARAAIANEPGAGSASAPRWYCSVWPVAIGTVEAEQRVLEILRWPSAAQPLGRHAAISERLLLSALREQALAESADAARARAAFSAAASVRLSASLDQEATYTAVAHLALPNPGAWCIVDVLELDGTPRRLPIVHPDPAKQLLVGALDGRWLPKPSDPIGVPVVRDTLRSVVIYDASAESPTPIAGSLDVVTLDDETRHILHALGAGILLVVPIIVRGAIRGAITFGGRRADSPYEPEEIALAEDLAARCAAALDSARLFEAAAVARVQAETAAREATDAQLAAEAANAAKGQFLASMSHELRTPLNAILGYAELMSLGIAGPVTGTQLDFLTRVDISGRHLLGLINSVLNFATIESGRLQFTLADVPLDEVLVAMDAVVAPQMRSRGLRYSMEPALAGSADAKARLVVRADPEKLRQILVNLLTNAMKFTASGGEITVTCGQVDDNVVICVTDTGIGIAADQLEAVFDPFVQVGKGHTSTNDGIGLGLAISRDLALGMHGTLTLESTLGEGAVFTLTLPAGQGAEAEG